jgi:hypothetical protein
LTTSTDPDTVHVQAGLTEGAGHDHHHPDARGGGYRNLMRLYPDRGVGVVAMGNATSYDVDGLVTAIAEPWLHRP